MSTNGFPELVALLAAGGLLSAAVNVSAQDAGSEGAARPAEENASRGRTLEVADDGVEATLERPVGWVAAETETGAAATLEASSDRRARIEVRVSSPIRTKKQASFFNSFHSKLKSAGFVEVETKPEAAYGGKKGREVEYEGQTKGETYRLVVWQYYRNEAAWIVAGFFPADRRDLHYEDFQALVESLSPLGDGAE